MATNIFRVLHAYHPDDTIELEKIDIFVYRDSFIIVGYTQIGAQMSSFIHYEFNDLGLKDIYSTQLQRILDQVPAAYSRAKIKNIYHAEPHYILIPNKELNDINGYKAFGDLHSISVEKLLTDTIPAIHSTIFYNYPYRVYNDFNFAFENATFHASLKPMLETLKKNSVGKTIFYASIKSKFVEINCFRDEVLLFSNSFEYNTKAEIVYFIQAVLSDMGLNDNSDDIYISCIRKDEIEDFFNTFRSYFPHFNDKATETFGFPADFWSVYGDMILCS